METRDFLQKQIDQLGQVLTALFNKLVKGTAQHASLKDQEIIQVFQDELSIDLNKAGELSQTELMDFLINGRGYSFENLERLAKMISHISANRAGSSSMDNTLINLERSILDHLTAHDKNFSFAHQMRIEQLEKAVLSPMEFRSLFS